jgi:signal transduction histidine kinase
MESEDIGAARRRRLSRYAAYALAWTAAGLFLFTRDLTRRFYWNDPLPWPELLASWMTGAYISAALTPAVFWLGARWPIERRVWIRRTALHLLGGVTYAVLQLALEAAISVRLGILSSTVANSFWRLFPVLAVLGFHGNVLSYWAMLGIQSGLRYYRRYQARERDALRLELQASELQTALVRARLSALKTQLQPHFLFNTLNAVVVLVRQQNGRLAEETLARLSDLLRWVLEDVDTQEVPLRRELEYLRRYLAIEQVRFPDRLHVDIIVSDPDLLDAGVPHMGLQPIVENAIRHGLERSAAAGQIQLHVARADGWLEITVRDDGPGFPAEAVAEPRGIGLANTRARLRQLYGEAATLTTANAAHGGAIVTMRLPYHLADEDPPGESGRDEHATDHVDRR